MIPSDDEFETKMKQFINEDDLLLSEYIQRVARLPLTPSDVAIESPKIIRGEEQDSAFSLPDGFGIFISELSDTEKPLVLSNLRMVIWTAVKYIGRGLSLTELLEAGNTGLIAAAKTYNPVLSVQFSEYSLWYVRSCITRAIFDKAPQRKNDNQVRPIISEEKKNNENEECEHPNDADEASVLESTVTQELLREDLIVAFAGLSPRERDVLRLRFGLDDKRQRSLEEVAALFGVTRERIRQIEAKALRKLRHPNRPLGPDVSSELAATKRVPNKKFRDALKKLPGHKAQILRFKWGFADGQIHSVVEVAIKFGITSDEVDELEAEALSQK